jgi:hypothetical protein
MCCRLPCRTTSVTFGRTNYLALGTSVRVYLSRQKVESFSFEQDEIDDNSDEEFLET